MAFALKKGESVARGVKRIVRDELGKAVDGLRHGEARDEMIHDARKRLKKVRAVLRLVRDGLGDHQYRRENTAFRDAARPLTHLRDSKVLLDALAGLKDRVRCGDETQARGDRVRGDASTAARGTSNQQHRAAKAPTLTAMQLAALDKGLQAHQRAVRNRVLKGKTLGAVADAIEEARDHVGDWGLARRDWSALGGGLKRAYKRGRRAFAAASADSTVENLHEWRKLAKYLWHQIQVVERAAPDELGKLANEFHELTRLLGDDHDLAVLAQTVAARPRAFGGGRVLGSLRRVIDRRRAELQQQAFALGSRLYEERPRAFLARIKRDWKAWRSG
jgi:CHAD domain-containing protein